MAFNARWPFEQLSEELSRSPLELLLELQADFQEMVETCPTYRLELQPNGNCFRLQKRDGTAHTPRAVAGLYTIFTADAVVYFGEASDLYRRLLNDPDNRADSGKVFRNQGRAVIKLLIHRRWAERLRLVPLVIQLYSGDWRLRHQANRTFEECYRIAHFSKALEGASALYVPRYHSGMLARATAAGVIDAHG